MTLYERKERLRLACPFFLVTITTWVVLAKLACTGFSFFGAPVLFAVAATGFTYLILKQIGYFSALRPLPRKSDGFLVFCALPGAGLLAEILLRGMLKEQGCSMLELMLYTPIMAVVVFAAYYYLPRLALRQRRNKRKIVLDVSPLEGATIIKEFAGLGLSDCIEYVTKTQMIELLLENRLRDIALVIISRRSARRFREDRPLLRAHLAGVPVVDYSSVLNEATGRVSLAHTDLWSFLMTARPQTALLRFYSVAKAAAEPALALALGIVFAPFMLLIALLIKREDGGPIFYRQRRVGLHDRPFDLVKFRSMRVDAELNGPQWATKGDDRMTGIGRLLRATRMDEVPQLWNVVRAEMGFFGPRPERPEICEQLRKQIPLFPLRTIVRPGVTGWAQTCTGYASTVEDSRRKLEYDLYYIQNMSPRLDLIILIRTIAVAVLGSKALQVHRNFALARESLFGAGGEVQQAKSAS